MYQNQMEDPLNYLTHRISDAVMHQMEATCRYNKLLGNTDVAGAGTTFWE